MTAGDEVFDALVAQGVDPAEARRQSDEAAVLREQNKPQPLDLKDVYSKSAAKDPRPPDPGDKPPGFNQAVYDDLVSKGYDKAVCLGIACKGLTAEASRDEAKNDDFIRHIYRKTEGGKS